MKVHQVDDIWTRKLNGDRTADSELYAILFPQLVLTAYSVVRQRQDAQDLAAETMVKVMTIEGGEEVRNIRNWAITACRNAALSEVRLSNRRREILEKEMPPKDQVRNATESELRMKELERLISDELEEPDRTIWSMHLQGFDNTEIGNKCQMIAKTVANRKSMIRKSLMELLHDWK